MKLEGDRQNYITYGFSVTCEAGLVRRRILQYNVSRISGEFTGFSIVCWNAVKVSVYMMPSQRSPANIRTHIQQCYMSPAESERARVGSTANMKVA